MHQQKKDEESRDPYAMLSGGDPPDDYPDWNNPEDREGAPEGYYDEETDEDDDSYVPGPDDPDDSYVPGPDDPDYDLSEAHGYADWDEDEAAPLMPQWLIAAISIILILGLVIPAIFLLR